MEFPYVMTVTTVTSIDTRRGEDRKTTNLLTTSALKDFLMSLKDTNHTMLHITYKLTSLYNEHLGACFCGPVRELRLLPRYQRSRRRTSVGVATLHTPAYTHPEQSGKQQKNDDRKHPLVINFNEKENVNDLKLFQNKDPH